MVTENPAFAGGPDEAAAANSMGIKAGLRDGTLTSDEAIVLNVTSPTRDSCYGTPVFAFPHAYSSGITTVIVPELMRPAII
eukprot:COSAG01_NODE_7150_length_3329_cov_2.649845_8_plen_81_part_00